MQRGSIRSKGPGAPQSIASMGSVSAVGPTKAAPKPRVKNTRDYGKLQPEEPLSDPQSPNPFGSAGGY